MKPREESLDAFIDTLPFIDTHSHAAGYEWGTPVDDRQGRSLPQILVHDYLAYVSSSCVDFSLTPPPPRSTWSPEDAPEQFRHILPLLETCRGLTLYQVLRDGIRELYPFEDEDITAENWEGIHRAILAAYQTHGERALHRLACRKAGIIRQTHMCFLPYVVDHWDALPEAERQAQRDLLMPSLILDGFLFSGFAANRAARERSLDLLGLRPATHADHLDFCRRALDLFIERGGVSAKLLAGYVRPLEMDEVSDRDAGAFYSTGPEKLHPSDLRRLQDNLLAHLLEMCRTRNLPLIVHAGYSVPTAWADPEHLHPLFCSQRLKGLKVDICHTGWPNHGAAMIMARTYRTCYFNLCGTSSFSGDLGLRLLSEALDMIPMNKILLGTDCGTPESLLGTARLIRRQLAHVLSAKLAAGQVGPVAARNIARALLHDNAAEFYGLRPSS
ncbi:MAG: amidohydrolase family protein [Planctomycetes bacterium]|nr:amidohydrolase family protein [Planctomycetota bacterium]